MSLAERTFNESAHDPVTASSIDDRLRFEAMLADVSARFVSVPADQVDAEIIRAQGMICECLGLDRSTLWQATSTEYDDFELTHWHGNMAGQAVPERPSVRQLFPWAVEQVLRGKPLAIADLADVPSAAARDLETWRQYGTRSSLVLPLSAGGGAVFGLLTFAAIQQGRDWPAPIVTRCRLLAEVFANALARKRSEQAMRESEERYRSITQSLPGVVYQFHVRDGVWSMSYVDVRSAQVFGVSAHPFSTFIDRFMGCVAEEDRERFMTSVREAIGAAAGWECAFRFVRPDGREMHLKGFSEPTTRGAELIYTGVLRDVTEARRAEMEREQTFEELKRLREQLQHENVRLRREVQSRQGQMPLVGSSAGLRKVLTKAEQVSGTDSTVLILGETGTGKELLARHIHDTSRRCAKPFITTNLAAIPGTLLESELFGREKGAYTGAMTRQAGRFELADGGTLFLDEIGEMPLETQAKLLRVLQSGELERLGSGRTQKVNVRVIAATNRKLPEQIRAGSFREDLYYRLNIFPITLPPLRERVEDIPLLVWSFVRELSERMGKPIDRIRKEDMEALGSYSWPGNVRELRNLVERSMILASGRELVMDLPDQEGGVEAQGEGVASRTLRDVQRQHILRVLGTTKGRLRGPGGAAEVLGMKPTTLYSLMERRGI